MAAPEDLPAEVLQLYKKYGSMTEKTQFRQHLAQLLGESFVKMGNALINDGVIAFKELISPVHFAEFIAQYDAKIKQGGESVLGYNFLNFKTHKDFLLNSNEVKENCFHPLLIALLAYKMGSPIRLVDTRGKDAEPQLTTERDNGVHVDDTLYNEELKIIVLWKLHENAGPQGQNFVALPKTHELIRLIPSEHGANFKKPQHIIKQFFHNEKIKSRVYVSEFSDEKPLTALFEASALAHHRFRTTATEARSCVILAFHADDENNTPQPFYNDESINDPLMDYILGARQYSDMAQHKREGFLSLLEQNKNTILEKISEISEKNNFILAEDKKLSSEKVLSWLATIENTPQLNDSKVRFKLEPLDKSTFIDKLTQIMSYDIHWDLDLKLYPNREELPRKLPRTRIREAGLKAEKNRSSHMYALNHLEKPSLNHLLPNSIIIDNLLSLSANLQKIIATEPPFEQKHEFIGMYQLLIDLAEALNRSNSVQDYRTNCLFIYWTFDESVLLFEKFKLQDDGLLLNTGMFAKHLLQHYAATVLIDDFSYEKPEFIPEEKLEDLTILFDSISYPEDSSYRASL